MIDGQLIDSSLMPIVPWATLQMYINFQNDRNQTYTLITDIGLTYRYRYHFALTLEVTVKSVDISAIIEGLRDQWRLILSGMVYNYYFLVYCRPGHYLTGNLLLRLFTYSYNLK